MTISPRIVKLVAEYELWRKESEVQEEDAVIVVDEVVARVASFYEKIRGIVDWREEHLLRKTAIERILKRRLAVHRVGDDFAENFLTELVRGGHFPNKRITLDKVDEIQVIIGKYTSILRRYRASQKHSKRDVEEWLLAVAAVEIEESLSLPRRERGLIECMAENLSENIHFISRKNAPQADFSPQEQYLQVYVAVQKALFKLDDSTIGFHILEKFYADWKNPSQETLGKIAERLEPLKQSVDSVLAHPYREKFYQIAEKYDTAYLIVHDILTEESERFSALAENPVDMEEAIRASYNRRHIKLKGRIRRAALYSTLSVFITKILLALLVEIPFDRYVAGEVHYSSIGVNIAIPAALMILLVSTAQTTSSRNIERVMIEVMKIMQVRAKGDVYKVFPPKKRGGVALAFVYGLYAVSFLGTFGLLVWLLGMFHFSALSIFIFLTFVSLVLFAGTKIRQRARELMIEPAREGFLYNIFDIFSLPMIQVGRWLSAKLVRYNVFVLAVNFLIEVPFQIFIEFLEHWRGFLREKKEEIH